jgi:hypothetical protein
MNKPSSATAPRGKVGKYFIQNGSVQFDQAKDKQLPVMMGEAYVAGFVFDHTSKTVSYAIAVIPHVHFLAPCMVRVEASTLSNQKEICGILGERGIVICNASHVSKYLVASASELGKSGPRELVKRPGWIAGRRGYFTGSKLIAASGLDADAYWFECSNTAVMYSRGDLDTWREQIGTLIVNNPIMLYTTCHAIASLFLAHLRLSSNIVNLVGGKGLGKTTALQGAASVFGNAIDPAQGAQAEDPAYISRFHGTMNGYEPLLGQYSPAPVLLDELTEASAAVTRDMCYGLTSGRAKIRLRPDGKAAYRESWQLNVITSAEESIYELIAKIGRPMRGGEADRAIDVPVTDVGVLNCYEPFKSFNAATSHLKRACSEQYGTPVESIIQFCCDNPEQLGEILAMSDDIEDELLPADCGPGERRVVKRFAAAVVAGRIAVAAGVFDQGALEKIDAAIKLVTELWWGARAGALERVRRFLEENIDKVEFGKPDLESEVVAFVDENYIVFPKDVFDREFGEDAESMLNEMNGLNALKQEQKGRHVHRFRNGQFRGYALFSKRVWPEMNQRAA